MRCFITRNARKTILALAVIAVAAGCQKKQDQAASSPPPAETPATTAPTPSPGVAQPVVVQNVDQSLADVNAALKTKAYEKAVQTLLAVQQQKLSDEQAKQAARQMRGLQASLAAALAAGDPGAKAAADQLRHAHQ